MNQLFFNPKTDNIFEFSFMDDFTTIILAEEEYGMDISKLKYKNRDDFYCFSEKKSYTPEEIYRKFSIEVSENIGN